MMRQQKWAHGALVEVRRWRGSEHEAKLRTLCMKTPSLIHTAGAAQAVTFLMSRDKEVGKQFVQAVVEVLHGPTETEAAYHERLLRITQVGEYMTATRDLVAVAVWFRRFAQIELDGDDAGGLT